MPDGVDLTEHMKHVQSAIPKKETVAKGLLERARVAASMHRDCEGCQELKSDIEKFRIDYP